MNAYKLVKKPFFGRFMVSWESPLSDGKRKEWQPLMIKSKSGASLAALFATSLDMPAKATIVLGHPMGKDAKGYFLKHGYTDLLRQNGYNVMVFDFNGFGESTHGNLSYFEDIVAVSKKAKELSPDLPIGYHGISLGGQMATIAFADPTHTYDFAIVESAAPTLDEFWIYYPLAYKTLQVLNFLLPKYKKKINMEERIKEAKNLSSLLYIYSNKDDFTPPDMGKRFLRNTPVIAELWTVKNARHANIMRSPDKQQYEDKILSYFNESISIHRNRNIAHLAITAIK